MLTWIISGRGLPDLKIQAESFDEALEEARRVDANYCSGHVVNDKEKL